MKKFKELKEEITVFTVKNEDVPTTSVGNAPAGMVDEPIVKKKKDKKVTLIDGRTKAYRKHRQKLEAQRQKRISKKELDQDTSHYINSVKGRE